jgi:hypothetical protein
VIAAWSWLTQATKSIRLRPVEKRASCSHCADTTCSYRMVDCPTAPAYCADTAKAKRIPALFVTGYVRWLHERHPKLDLNAYNVLRKPVTPQVLLLGFQGPFFELSGHLGEYVRRR